MLYYIYKVRKERGKKMIIGFCVAWAIAAIILGAVLPEIAAIAVGFFVVVFFVIFITLVDNKQGAAIKKDCEEENAIYLEMDRIKKERGIK
jgi:hypothetical protein